MKSNKFVRGIFGLILSCFVIVGITSCEPPSGGYSPQINYLAAVDGVPAAFLGTWENNDWGYHSEYILKKNQINDKSMSVLYNVVSASTVTTADGYTLVFCQVAEGSGTAYTPAGNFYAVGIKLDGGSLKICCPLDYQSVLTTLEGLKNKYPSSFNFAGSGNYETVCTKIGEAVSVTEKTMSATMITFTKIKVSLFEMGGNGWHEDSDTIFTPIRDKSKENSDVKLYLYGTRNTVMDDPHIEIKKNSSGELAVYYYVYDDEEDGNYYESYWDYDMFPTVSDDDLIKILALYK